MKRTGVVMYGRRRRRQRGLKRGNPAEIEIHVPPLSFAVDGEHMRDALAEAVVAYGKGEVPVGAVLVCRHGNTLVRAHNCVEAFSDASAHAELLCIRAHAHAVQKCEKCAREFGPSSSPWRMLGCTLYCTLEPCAMCFSALQLARVDRVVYAARDKRLGAAGSWIDLQPTAIQHPFHTLRVQQYKPAAAQASALLRSFFQARRRTNQHARATDPP